MKPSSKDQAGCLNTSILVVGQLFLLLLLTGVFIVIDFWPTYGAPFFRYTGSNPDEKVWNLGFPIAWFIYDDNTLPHWFTAFPEMVMGIIGAQSAILLLIVIVPWLQRKR